MHHQSKYYYRSLELLCRKQAALSSTSATRKELERMAVEYQRIADWLEQQRAPAGAAQEQPVK
jgi:hypothetical protein